MSKEDKKKSNGFGSIYRQSDFGRGYGYQKPEPQTVKSKVKAIIDIIRGKQ